MELKSWEEYDKKRRNKMGLGKKIAIIVLLSIMGFFCLGEELIIKEIPIAPEGYQEIDVRISELSILFSNTYSKKDSEFYIELDKFLEELFSKSGPVIDYYTIQLEKICNENKDNRIIQIMIRNYIYPELEDYYKVDTKLEPPVYLPNYGYTDNNYIYKYGKELSKEEVSQFWKVEKRRIESSTTHEFYIKSELVSGSSQGGSIGGNIEGFKVTGEAKFEINGKLESFSRCEIILKETVETQAMILYKKNKVYLELWRAKKGFFGWLFNGMDFEWELDGSTYVFKEEPASTEVIIDPEQVINIH